MPRWMLFWSSTACGAATFAGLMTSVTVLIGAVTGGFAGGVLAYLAHPATLTCVLSTIPLLTVWIAATDQVVCRATRFLPVGDVLEDGVAVATSVAAIGVIFFLPVYDGPRQVESAVMAIAVVCGLAAGTVRGYIWERGGGNTPAPDIDVFA